MSKLTSELKPETLAIIAQIRALPYGQVSSYRDIAWLAGLGNGARQVARVLHSLSAKYELPWWRIIGSDGCVRLPSPERQEQIKLLRAEGIEVSDTGRVTQPVSADKIENVDLDTGQP